MRKIKYLHISCFKCLLVCLLAAHIEGCACNMQHDKDTFSPNQFQMQMEQYITTHACLSPQEAAAFFPVYSELQKKLRVLHEELKKIRRFKPVSNEECRKNIQRIDKIELEMKQLQRRYHEQFMKILSPSKVYDVIKAEDKFHRQAFKKMINDIKKGKKKR